MTVEKQIYLLLELFSSRLRRIEGSRIQLDTIMKDIQEITADHRYFFQLTFAFDWGKTFT